MDDAQNRIQRGFLFLHERYQFSPPEFERLGRESYVRFHRNAETISFSIEVGSDPIIELFLRCEGTQERPVPWLEIDGVKRYRKYPKMGPIRDFFIEAPEAFEQAEKKWLAGEQGQR